MLVCNGHAVRHPDHAPVPQRMVLLKNIGGEYFQEMTEQVGNGLTTLRNTRGLAEWRFANGLHQGTRLAACYRGIAAIGQTDHSPQKRSLSTWFRNARFGGG